ncbi:MAG: isoprenoid biosynthesis glyoxalase ElbB [Deltaproteobacteria bacterium]|nr:isoprenoid biosynthesis glyoxalase ElbB [Deltaproteobacteria bacterium]
MKRSFTPRSNATQPSVWILLSGCGLHDGTEPHEAALLALALARHGITPRYCAPDMSSSHTVDHHRGELARHDARDVLSESARLARGVVEPLSTVDPTKVDVLLIPGGYGAVKVLCDYARRARACVVHPEVETLVRALHARGVPVGALCVSTVLIARVLGSQGVQLGLGWDSAIDADCASWGAQVQRCEADRVVVDRAHRVVSTPALSASRDLAVVAQAIDRTVAAVLELR